VLNGLVRPGISIGPEDVRPRLPSWRRNEYCQALKAFAASIIFAAVCYLLTAFILIAA